MKEKLKILRNNVVDYKVMNTIASKTMNSVQ